MCNVAVKRRLPSLTSICSATSRSVLPACCHESFRLSESCVFLPEMESDGPQVFTGKAGDLTPIYRDPRLHS